MKMADLENADCADPECLANAELATACVGSPVQEEPLKSGLETTTSSSSPREKEMEGEPGLLSMPCLMKELRRDSPESQQASTGSDRPASQRVDESSDSNPCMLSPSSSGHLADSDTLSSGDDGAASRGGADPRGGAQAGAEPRQMPGGHPFAPATGGRKSRRSRSESETPASTMVAKKNRCQHSVAADGGPEKQSNGKLAKVKGPRSQKHKERMRLLRQKREAAARKKYNLLQDSSTSDSELTCDSSTSSSEDEDDTSGASKTINTDIPDGPPVVGHYDISDTDSNQECMSVETVRPTVIKRELKTHRGQDMAAHSGCIRALSSLSGQVELSKWGTSQHKAQINVASSDSEVEIVGVQENSRCAHPCGGVIKSLSSWKGTSAEQVNSTRQPQLWTTVSPQPNWAFPSEVVDLTLDEDAGHKFLL